jgi:hypothetical protein
MLKSVEGHINPVPPVVAACYVQGILNAYLATSAILKKINAHVKVNAVYASVIKCV